VFTPSTDLDEDDQRDASDPDEDKVKGGNLDQSNADIVTDDIAERNWRNRAPRCSTRICRSQYAPTLFQKASIRKV